MPQFVYFSWPPLSILVIFLNSCLHMTAAWRVLAIISCLGKYKLMYVTFSSLPLSMRNVQHQTSDQTGRET